MLLSGISFSQVKTVKPVAKPHPKTSNFSIGAGVTSSVLYLARNVKENNNARGFNLNMAYGVSRLLRVNAEYTFYRPLNIQPTWYNIRAHTWEANLHIIARFANTPAYFYPMFGISYNVFSGLYTGISDFLNLSALYKANEQVTTRWYGINIGTGYERFFKPLSVFAEYKMKVGVSEGYNELNIMDVCLSAGVRYNLRVPSVHRLFRGTRSRYLLDTRGAD